MDASVAANKPWFINAWFHVSHASLTPTAEQIGNFSFTASFASACRLGAVSSGQTTCAHQLMWAAQAHADAEVGRLLRGSAKDPMYYRQFIFPSFLCPRSVPTKCVTRHTKALTNAPRAMAPCLISTHPQGLRDRHQWAGTLIAFSTDNGPEEPMVFTNGVASANPFRCTREVEVEWWWRMRWNGGGG